MAETIFKPKRKSGPIKLATSWRLGYFHSFLPCQLLGLFQPLSNQRAALLFLLQSFSSNQHFQTSAKRSVLITRCLISHIQLFIHLGL